MNLTINNVRLSYPNLFKPKAMQEGDTPKYSAAFILDTTKHAKDIAAIKAAMNQVAEEKWGKGKVPKGVKYCLRSGEEEGRKDVDGYGPGTMFFNASNDKKIPVVGRNVEPLTAEDGKPYAGCYVNVMVRFWAQDNSYGKRVNAQLRTVQFVKDGQAFGDKPTDPKAAFQDLGDAPEADANDLL